MPKEKIAIVSLLKPVDDVRSYHKMALTLLSTKRYEMHLIGYPSQQPTSDEENLYFLPLHAFAPKGFVRLLIPISVLLKVLKVKPRLVIANSPELLPVMVMYKILFGCKLLYDIQENYNLNLRYQSRLPRLVRSILGYYIRSLEILSSPFVDHFILAERCYARELRFIPQRHVVIENKSILQHQPKVRQDSIRLLFSGTLTESNGIFMALEIMRQLHALDAEHVLAFSIVGHCPQPHVMKSLQQNKHIIDLNVSTKPIPYKTIANEIAKSDLGLVTYKVNPSNASCMPTKVYDYAASGLPMLFEKGSLWGEWVSEKECGFGIDLQQVDYTRLLSQVKSFVAKQHTPQIKEASWSEEEPKLISIIKDLT